MTAEQLKQVLMAIEDEVKVAEVMRSINTDIEAKYSELERRIQEFKLGDPEPRETDYFSSL